MYIYRHTCPHINIDLLSALNFRSKSKGLYTYQTIRIGRSMYFVRYSASVL